MTDLFASRSSYVPSFTWTHGDRDRVSDNLLLEKIGVTDVFFEFFDATHMGIEVPLPDQPEVPRRTSRDIVRTSSEAPDTPSSRRMNRS